MDNNALPRVHIRTLQELETAEVEMLEYAIIWANETITLSSNRVVEIFYHRYKTGKINARFTEDEYLSNKDIQQTITAFGLDASKFWYLMLIIYDYIWCLFEKGAFLEDVCEDDAAKMIIDSIGDGNEENIQISIKKNNKHIKITPVGIRAILNMLKEGYDRIYKNPKQSTIYVEDFKSAKLSSSYKIYMANMLYQDVFQKLIDTHNVTKPSAYSTISLDKMLFVSRIVYFYGWTANHNYLRDDNSIRGLINRYKERTKSIPLLITPEYLIEGTNSGK